MRYAIDIKKRMGFIWFKLFSRSVFIDWNMLFTKGLRINNIISLNQKGL